MRVPVWQPRLGVQEWRFLDLLFMVSIRDGKFLTRLTDGMGRIASSRHFSSVNNTEKAMHFAHPPQIERLRGIEWQSALQLYIPTASNKPKKKGRGK